MTKKRRNSSDSTLQRAGARPALGNNFYQPDHSRAESQRCDDVVVVCPSYTTERKLLARIDLHVIPYLCILYVLAFLDRVNIGNAVIFGLRDDLGLVGDQYNIALVIFFVPYVIFEIPSNILLKKFKPRIWLSVCMFLFGLAALLQGFVQNYAGLLATRFFLGLFETGMFPGCFYLISMWYKRSEGQKRYSFFFSSTSLAGAFGGLLAAAIGKMDGVRGYLGWRWIFILEGLVTCVIAIIFFFVLPNFPEDSTWLTRDERDYVKARLEIDQGKSAIERPITLKDVSGTFKDFKIFIGGFMYFGLVIPAYAYAYFSPTIIRGFMYSPIKTQLYSVPPWAAAFALSMIIAYLSDRLRHRFAFAIVPILIALAGFSMLISVENQKNVQYAALFLVTCGCYSAMPVILCWFTMNLGGHRRRAVGTGWQIGFGNAGGIVAVFSFLPGDEPLFKKGSGVCLAFVAFSGAWCIAYLVTCIWENTRRNRSIQDLDISEYEKAELGDLSTDYRYQL